MKLVVDLRKLSNKPSGIGIYTYNLIKGLISTGEIELIGITDVLESAQIKELDKQIKIHVYGNSVDRSFDIFPYFLFIKEIVKNENPDYFYEPNFIAPINVKSKDLKTKMLINIYDISPITFKDNYSFGYRMYFELFLRKTLAYTDKIVYISMNGKNETTGKFKKAQEIDSSIVYPIINKIEVDEPIEEKDYFLFLGNVEKRKGIDILIDSYIKYVDCGGDKDLLIAGGIRDKGIEEKILKAIQHTNQKIKLLGYISNEQKKELFRNCSAFVFPSYSEGFGIPPVEALSINKAIIVSNIPVFKEAYSECGNYFTLDINSHEISVNSLKEKLLNYKKPNEQCVRQLLNRYSQASMVNEFMGLL